MCWHAMMNIAYDTKQGGGIEDKHSLVQQICIDFKH